MTIPNEAFYQEQYAANTGNTNSVASTFQRDLNTEVFNNSSGAIAKSTANAGAVTLQGPGTFILQGDAVGHGLTGGFRNQLITIGGGTMVGGVGVSLTTPTTGYEATSEQLSVAFGQVTISDSSTVDVAIQTNYEGAVTGTADYYGAPTNDGNPEVYAWLHARQIA